MRLVFAGDWHADTIAAEAAVEQAKDAGASWIIHVGDFFYTGNTGDRFLNALNGLLLRNDLQLVFIRGNHDDTNVLRRYADTAERDGTTTPEGFVPLRQRVLWAPDGLVWNWDEVNFGALGGAPSIDRKLRVENQSWWADEETTDEAVEIISKSKKVDVLVMHDVPSSIVIRDMPVNEEFGKGNRARLQLAVSSLLPSWMFSGHYHGFQRDEITYPNGQKVRSVILDRGDYDGEQRQPRRISSSLFFAEIIDGEMQQMYY